MTDCLDLLPAAGAAVLACAETPTGLTGWALHGAAVAGLAGATGVRALDRDRGPAADVRYRGYAVAPGVLYGLSCAGVVEPLLRWKAAALPFIDLAVWNNTAAVSGEDGVLRLVDLARRRLLRIHRLPALRGVAFAADGRLLALTNTQLVSYRVDVRTGQLADKRILIASGLHDPRRIIVGPCKIKFFITDWGQRHQVLIYTQDGVLERTLGPQYAGQPGDPGVAYLDHPEGMAITADGVLWVAESTRLTRWRLRDGVSLGPCPAP